MKTLIFTIFILFITACNNNRNSGHNVISPTGPDTPINPVIEITTLNYEIELLSYTSTDGSVKMRMFFKNTGDVPLTNLSLVFKGDTCDYGGNPPWKEVIMRIEDNINLAVGDTYKSVNYDGKYWYYFIHSNVGHWIGIHYVTYFVYNSDSSILATATLYYDEIF